LNKYILFKLLTQNTISVKLTKQA